jgi:hypothetical protein
VKTLEYEVVIEDAAGRRKRTVVRIATTGRPLVGEEMVVDGLLYEVRRVRHEQEEGRTLRIYTWPRVFVRAKAERG